MLSEKFVYECSEIIGKSLESSGKIIGWLNTLDSFLAVISLSKEHTIQQSHEVSGRIKPAITKLNDLKVLPTFPHQLSRK